MKSNASLANLHLFDATLATFAVFKVTNGLLMGAPSNIQIAANAEFLLEGVGEVQAWIPPASDSSYALDNPQTAVLQDGLFAFGPQAVMNLDDHAELDLYGTNPAVRNAHFNMGYRAQMVVQSATTVFEGYTRLLGAFCFLSISDASVAVVEGLFDNDCSVRSPRPAVCSLQLISRSLAPAGVH